MDLNRYIPPRYFRNLLIVLLAALVIAAIAIVVGVVYVFLTFHPPTGDVSGLPPWVKEILLPILQNYSKVVLGVISAVGFAFVCLVLFIGVNFIRADKVKFFGLEFQVSDELSRTQRELEGYVELVAALQENFSEIQELIEQQSHVFRKSSVNKYCDYLDKIVETGAFVVRPRIRSVRAAIWLYRKSSDKMRIVAGYRTPQRTLRELEMKLDGDGFAPMVLRAKAPQTRNNPEPGREWEPEPDNITKTTSILGQPIQVASNDDWQAVLCFSTDRDTAKFPQYAFSVKEDAATLRLFAEIIAFALTLATEIVIQDSETPTPLIDRIHERYT